MRDDSSVKLRVGAIVAIVLYLTWVWQGSNLCINLSGTSDPSGLKLADLSNLKIDGSSATSDLLNGTYWNSVYAAYGNSLLQILPNTVIGLINSSNDWRTWSFRNIPSPPPWLSSGITQYMQEQFFFVRDKALATNNATLAGLTIKGLATSIAGFSLAVLDFVSFNGITAIRTYLETGSLLAAFCATSPSQLGVLYNQAFASNVPRELRAQYLGNALALTTVMIVLAGKDGFAPKFQEALNRVGLADAWGTIKPYLSRIGSSVSMRASSAVFGLLETVAKRFPQDSTWATGLTADRIESMVEVLHDKGLTSDAIEQKVQGLARAANNAPNENAVGDAADRISYRDGGGVKVKIDSQNRIYLYTDRRTMSVVTAKFLQDEVSGFEVHTATSLKVTYVEKGITFYHYYTGGDNWIPTVPKELGRYGDVMTIAVSVLTRDDFVNSIPKLALSNDIGVRWLSNKAELTGLSVTGDLLRIDVSQTPALEGVSAYIIEGIASKTLGFNKGITYLDFQVTDVFGQPRAMRLNFDGYNPAYMGVLSGPDYSPVFFLSSDGARLRFVSNSGGSEIEIATIYLEKPNLYNLGDMNERTLGFTIDGVYKAYQIDRVDFQRQLDSLMARGSKYDVGRIGAELAYTVGTDKLGLKDIVLVEPSKGGKDLYTLDGKVVFQARMLSATPTTASAVNDLLKGELTQMVDKLRNEDFKYNPSAVAGYAVLSYIDIDNTVKVVVVEVLPP